jgi:hypothetical protein
MSTLRSQLEQIANEFVSSLLEAMKSAPLAELADGSTRASTVSAAPRGRGRPPKTPAAAAPARTARGGRRKRSSAEEVQKLKDTAYAAAKALGKDFSKGDIMKKSGSKVDLGRALTLLVADGKLSKKGDRRMTRYSVK